jgi:hypothetical protein
VIHLERSLTPEALAKLYPGTVASEGRVKLV